MEPIDPSTFVLGSDDTENTLDEHFLSLVLMTCDYFSNLVENQDIDLCKAWLVKLCSEEVFGSKLKRFRNTYLFHLLLGMQNGLLDPPFTKPPPEGTLKNPDGIFGPTQPDVIIKRPGWLEDVIEGGDVGLDFAHHSKDGRIYLASKELDNGRGAFAYLSVTLAKETNIGSGEGTDVDLMPDSVEMGSLLSGRQNNAQVEKLLAKRRSAPERNRLVRFYRDIVQSVTNELNGEGNASALADRLIVSLEDDLKNSGEKPELWKMNDEEQRLQLLIQVRERVEGRLQQVKLREQALDKLEREMLPGATPSDDKFDDEVWEDQCQMDFKDKNMALLLRTYPRCVSERFVELIIDERMKVFKKWRRINKEFSNECYADMEDLVKDAMETYKKARTEWETISPVVKALKAQMLRIEQQEREKREEMKIRQMEQNATIEEENRHMESLLLEIKKSQKTYDRDYQVSENLRKSIEKEQEQLQKIDTYMTASHEHDELDMIALRREIEKMQSEIKTQESKIGELQEIVKSRPTTST